MTAAASPPVAQKGLITVSVMLATIMQVLDTTIANVALPHIQGSISATQDQVAWVLAGELWAIRNLAAGPDDGARRMLGMLGVLMAPGYLAERYVRAHLRPGGWDPVETPVVVALIGLSAAMGVLGHRAQAGR